TEPSAEMDVECFVCRGSGCRMCKGEGWIEILGCGMVDPALFEWVGYDPERYSGFAFGLGVERVAALSHGISDIRYLYDNDARFLRQFEGAL
ncbi:MAG: phenylalanine--tRNA ligase subunit alpha, partial [Actinomycetota bacterium]|nr:phenylalanine--tRNA ligase subunit alpha [Actinomycetota bacterium]